MHDGASRVCLALLVFSAGCLVSASIDRHIFFEIPMPPFQGNFPECQRWMLLLLEQEGGRGVPRAGLGWVVVMLSGGWPVGYLMLAGRK